MERDCLPAMSNSTCMHTRRRAGSASANVPGQAPRGCVREPFGAHPAASLADRWSRRRAASGGACARRLRGAPRLTVPRARRGDPRSARRSHRFGDVPLVAIRVREQCPTGPNMRSPGTSKAILNNAPASLRACHGPYVVSTLEDELPEVHILGAQLLRLGQDSAKLVERRLGTTRSEAWERGERTRYAGSSRLLARAPTRPDGRPHDGLTPRRMASEAGKQSVGATVIGPAFASAGRDVSRLVRLVSLGACRRLPRRGDHLEDSPTYPTGNANLKNRPCRSQPSRVSGRAPKVSTSSSSTVAANSLDREIDTAEAGRPPGPEGGEDRFGLGRHAHETKPSCGTCPRPRGRGGGR